MSAMRLLTAYDITEPLWERVIVADLDLDRRRDRLELFPLLTTRRPDAYQPLT